MTSYVTPESSCPWCGHEMNRCTSLLELGSPSAGDLSICIKCSGFLVFDADLKLQKLEPHQEFQAALKDSATFAELVRMRSTIQEMNGGDRPS